MFAYVFLIYLLIGVSLNFYGPLKSQIWRAKMYAAADEKISTQKLFLFMLTLRTGVVLFYPLFILKK